MGIKKRIAERTAAQKQDIARRVRLIEGDLRWQLENVSELRDMISFRVGGQELIQKKFDSIRSELASTARKNQALRDAYPPSDKGITLDVRFMCGQCSRFMHVQMVALNLLLDTIAMRGLLRGPDVEYCDLMGQRCVQTYKDFRTLTLMVAPGDANTWHQFDDDMMKAIDLDVADFEQDASKFRDFARPIIAAAPD